MTDPEIARNAQEFRDGLVAALTANIGAVVAKNATKIDEAYARLTCLQAIKAYLLDGSTSEGALGFFAEAQGDGITSLVLVTSGSSRSSLKSLRSLIENIVRSIYYADHPVEYRLWDQGKHRPTFKSFFEYLSAHPELSTCDFSLKATETIYATWKKLSQSVHASVKGERMTDKSGKITVWKTNQHAVGQWATFQQAVIRDVCLLYLTLYSQSMKGATLKPLREALAIALPTKLDSKISANLGVKIVRA